MSNVRERARIEFHRVALVWHSFRSGRSRPVALRQEPDGSIRVHDGVRAIHVPSLIAARDFRGGIGNQLDQVAERYVGMTGYVPREGDVCVDVGAGIGEFTLWCKDAGAHVIAFEPDPSALRALERNVASLRDVRCLPCALWKERADLKLHIAGSRLGSSLIAGNGARATVNVAAWTLDSIPDLIALPVIDFMKISGGGVEPEIIVGGTRTMRRTRVVAIDLSAIDRRRNLRERVESALETLRFRPLSNGREDTIFALNTAMVGPFSSRAQALRGS